MFDVFERHSPLLSRPSQYSLELENFRIKSGAYYLGKI